MIQVYTLASTIPDLEEISVAGKLTSESDYIQLYIRKSDLTEEQQVIYTEGIGLFSGKYFIVINNIVSELVIDRVTSETTIEGEDIFDFETLSEIDKNKLNNLLAFFIELNS
jgi:hypothetical protein